VQIEKAPGQTMTASIAMPHGDVEKGLAAFLVLRKHRFKVGEPIPLRYGVVLVGPGLDKRNEETARLRMRVFKPVTPYDPGNYSWCEVTGPDGQKLPWRGGYDSLPMHIAPSDEYSPFLRHGEFLDNTYPDLGENGEFDLTRPGTYKVRWGYHPDEVEGVWSGGPLMSNEVQFEIIGDSAKAEDPRPMKDAPDGRQPSASDRMRKARADLHADFVRIFRTEEKRKQVLADDLASAKKRIVTSKDYGELFRMRFWCGENHSEIIPWLIDSLENRTFVGFEKPHDLIIFERIQTKDLQFQGHGPVSRDDLFTVAGRASWFLKAVTGEDFGSVKPDSTAEDLAALKTRWSAWLRASGIQR
jgi:hypothetical protein